jgi:hypothetical protein
MEPEQTDVMPEPELRPLPLPGRPAPPVGVRLLCAFFALGAIMNLVPIFFEVQIRGFAFDPFKLGLNAVLLTIITVGLWRLSAWGFYLTITVFAVRLLLLLLQEEARFRFIGMTFAFVIIFYLVSNRASLLGQKATKTARPSLPPLEK